MIDLENSMILEFELNKQTLKRIDNYEPVEKSQVYLQIHFNFDKDWDNTEKHVFFQFREEKIYEEILVGDTCYVPLEVIKKYGFYIWLVGYDLETHNVKMPTNQIRVAVKEGAPSDSGEATYVTDIVSDTITFEKSGNTYRAEIPNKYIERVVFEETNGKVLFYGRDDVKLGEIDLPTERIIKSIVYSEEKQALVFTFDNYPSIEVPMSGKVNLENYYTTFQVDEKNEAQTNELKKYIDDAIAGIDVDISREKLVSTIGEATTSLSGLMSAKDKARLNTLVELLNNGNNSIVDTIEEVLAVFEKYPQGVDIFTLITSKQDKINVDSNNDVLVFNEDELSTHYEVTSSSNVGGIKSGDNVSGTIKDVLDMLLGTPTAFAFNSIGGKNGGTYEKGFSITVSEAVATVTKGTAKTINSIVITSGGSTLGSTSSPQDGSNTIPLSTTSFNDSKTFNAVFTYNTSKTISKTITFTYIFRYYYGTTTKDLADLTASDITAMSGKVSATYSGIAITMNQSCSVIAVPNTTNYTVYDENGYNVTDNFEKKTLTITNTYGVSATYTIWKLKTAVTGSKTYRLA